VSSSPRGALEGVDLVAGGDGRSDGGIGRKFLFSFSGT
jgi:hypothetical protein